MKNIKNDKQDKSHKNIEKEWKSLISKHKLRYDIWMVIDLNNELNVTQISKKVAHSKSTISRVLKGMEIDELLVSSRGEIKEGGRERIPPKYYRIRKKYKKVKEEQTSYI